MWAEGVRRVSERERPVLTPGACRYLARLVPRVPLTVAFLHWAFVWTRVNVFHCLWDAHKHTHIGFPEPPALYEKSIVTVPIWINSSQMKNVLAVSVIVIFVNSSFTHPGSQAGSVYLPPFSSSSLGPRTGAHWARHAVALLESTDCCLPVAPLM